MELRQSGRRGKPGGPPRATASAFCVRHQPRPGPRVLCDQALHVRYLSAGLISKAASISRCTTISARGLWSRDRYRKVIAVEQVDEHVLRGELAHDASPCAYGSGARREMPDRPATNRLRRTRHHVTGAGNRGSSSTWRALDGSRTLSERDRVHLPDQDAALFVQLHASQHLPRWRRACADR
jgi:hypothetical protein